MQALLKKNNWFMVIFLLLTIVACLPNRQAAARARKYYAPVLMYHDIKVKPLNGFDVTTADFAKQLAWLEAEHYQTLSMDEYLDILDKGKPFPAKTILLTFDDGYEGVYTQAVPELIKHNMKATFFIFKNGIDTKLEGYPYLTSTEVKAMAANPLFSLESHTISHPDLTTLKNGQLKKELIASKKYLEKLTGKPCLALAYPFGHSNPQVIAETWAAGYEVAFSISDGPTAGFDTCYTIPRVYMGMALSENENKLFKQYVQTYANMPAGAFQERFGQLK